MVWRFLVGAKWVLVARSCLKEPAETPAVLHLRQDAGIIYYAKFAGIFVYVFEFES